MLVNGMLVNGLECWFGCLYMGWDVRLEDRKFVYGMEY